ncbi:probable calcium-binding protein CML32 [Phoenix dactylifera]|uniref:Probable calcium-binding protein CML32 n=1 Tax=Phoenix dactylifera TaxID=42345 RepID=A0A8B7C7I0_PHODC|nr:probable calcium-binding protein CML32 [Phoenix dactylifera]
MNLPNPFSPRPKSPSPPLSLPTAPTGMEGGGRSPRRSPALHRPSSSFRLRSPSLNTVRLRRVFDLFDHNGDGEITVDELALALDRLGLGADRDELGSTVAAYISPGGAGLGFDDFEALHRSLGDALFGAAAPGDEVPAAAEEEKDMREAFRVFDEDGDGFISAAELQVVLAKLGLPEARSIARVHEMICSVDQDRDGRVDFGEFKHMMQGISVRSA